MKPLFGGFLAMVMYCAVAHTDDDGFRDGGVLRRWCNPMMMTGFAMVMFLLWG